MTAARERVIIGEVLELLRMGDKDIADKYHKEIGKVQDFKDARIEAKLEVIADELDAEIEREAQEQDNSHYLGMAAGNVPEIR